MGRGRKSCGSRRSVAGRSGAHRAGPPRASSARAEPGRAGRRGQCLRPPRTPSGTKIAHGTSDLATYASVEEREIKPVLDSLARQRILRPLGENGHAGDRYEIFHDVLAGAVLAWSARHEADAALEQERSAAAGLGWLAAAALVGLALMAALAAYAFSQRSEAQEQTVAATQQRELVRRRTNWHERASNCEARGTSLEPGLCKLSEPRRPRNRSGTECARRRPKRSQHGEAQAKEAKTTPRPEQTQRPSRGCGREKGCGTTRRRRKRARINSAESASSGGERPGSSRRTARARPLHR